MSRLEAIRDWAMEYPGYDGLVKLNAVVISDADSGVSAEGGETVTATYIDGTEERQLEVVIRVAVPWSSGSDSINSEAAELMEGWAEWAADQWPDNPPQIDGAEVTAIEPVYTLPRLETVGQSTRQAVYKLTLDITIEEA